MTFNYVVEVHYRDGTMKSKLFTGPSAFDKANKYHEANRATWGGLVKKVISKRI